MAINDPSQLEKARLEDVLMELLYGKYDLTFHGGTCIWRCYNGNRFSRDLDFYMSAPGKEGMERFRELSELLVKWGFTLKEKGYSNVTNTMHFLVESTAKMKIDINFDYKKGSPIEYTRVDGSKITVLGLTPLELLNEKIDAYGNKMARAHKYSIPEVQDLYDMYHLVSLAGKDARTAGHLAKLIGAIKNDPPQNLRSLDHLILAGVAPSFELMIKRIERWIDDNKQ